MPDITRLSSALQPIVTDDAHEQTPDEFMFELMMTEWRGKVLASDGLTEEDSTEW